MSDPNEKLIHFSNIAYKLKSINSSIQKHVKNCQTTKFQAHEIEWFHSILPKESG